VAIAEKFLAEGKVDAAKQLYARKGSSAISLLGAFMTS
jgi:hypothetical protein